MQRLLDKEPTPFLTVSDAASILCVSHWVVRGWINASVLRRADLPGKNGKGKLDKILILRSDVDKLIEKASGITSKGDDKEIRTRLPKGRSVVDQVLSERTASLRVIQKSQKAGRR